MGLKLFDIRLPETDNVTALHQEARMNLPKDNLDSTYESFKKHPDDLSLTLDKFNTYTERTYEVFRDIVSKHEYMGEAAIVIMARNLATHLIDMARDQKSSYQQIVANIVSAIAPMFQMMYDRYTEEEEAIEFFCKKLDKVN